MMALQLSAADRSAQAYRASLAGAVALALAAVAVVGTGSSPLTSVLAAAAVIGLAFHRRLGIGGAALLVLVALPFGRGADVENFQIAGLPLRPQDLVVAAALIGLAASAVRTKRRLGGQQRTLIIASAVLLLVGAVALLIGVLEGHRSRDLFRDLRLWVLFAGAPLAYLGGVRRDQLVRALLWGATVFGLIVVVTAVMPTFDGGLKDQVLTYDRGTLRMQFANSIFLLPAIAASALAAIRRRSDLVSMGMLILFTVAVVLSLTRMSLIASLLVLVMVGVASLLSDSLGWRSHAAGILRLGAAVVVAVVLGVVISIAAFPLPSNAPGPGSGEQPIDRILGASDASDVDAVFGQRSGRIASYLEAYKLIRSDPLIGKGFGTLIPVRYAYNDARADVVGYQPGVDNAYLTVGIKSGVLGIVVFAAWILLPLFALWRRRGRHLLPWLVPAWVGILLLTQTQAFGSSGYAPFGIALLVALPFLTRPASQLLPRANPAFTR